MAASRDYYADLELPRDADVNDIKKQFRKLALKYHPDRNPGREQEVNAKFQIIQAAHEILSDPAEKAKYDASLGRGRYPGASGVRGNPWANAGAQFPTPPRRSNAATGAAPRNTQSNFKNAQSGAERWQSRFSSGVPPTAKQRFGADPEAKKNAAKAFENMRKNAQQNKPQSTEPPPPPPRQPPGTEYARQRAEASFGSRKSGYYPRSTMPGDEPPVASHNYSKFDRRDVPPPPPERPGPNPMPDPLSQFRERNDTSASTKSGRSDSAGGQQQRHNANGDTGFHGTGSAKSHPNARSNPDYVNVGASQTTTPTPTIPTADFAAKNKSSNTEEGPSMYANLYSQPFLTSQHLDKIYKHRLEPSPSQFGIKHRVVAIGLESSRSIGQDQSPSGTSCDSVASITFERKQTRILNELIDGKDQHLRLPQKIGLGSSMSTDKNARSQHEPLTNQGQNHSFSFPLDDDTFRQSGTRSGGHGFAKGRVDDIHTSFADDGGSRTWQFKAGTADAEANVGHDWSSPCARRNRQSRLKRPTVRCGDDSTNDNTASNASQVESGFNAEGWSDKFGPQTFVPQPVPGPCVSPSRTSRTNSRRSKAKSTAETAASHSTSASAEESSSDEESYEWRGRSAQAQARPVTTATDSPQAMDIDTPPMEGRRAQAARNIHVEPSRPEWRAGNVNGPTSPDGIPQRPAKLPLYVNAVGSEDTEEFRATLADLKNVAPFSHEKVGLDSLHGLKEHLPFESKASDVPPVKPPNPAKPLEFPHPPTAPRFVQPTGVTDEMTKPTTMPWNKYLAEFEGYLRQWDRFNDQVVDHFATRRALVSETRTAKGYGFLGARGDTEMQEYYNWVQQDNDVRGRWMDACTEHQNRLREFMTVREEMKRRG
ncbi:hypothetical protein E4U43_003805 [Claviceps pusilla]|uniref:J domain-containing protein n=1 Tax=Claviceps pusilla TaxID=123648 RepID=A0A9P7SUC5_9HYPO|nr:hypothetical protein E4U43_003805 [Claviceps pusilla]